MKVWGITESCKFKTYIHQWLFNMASMEILFVDTVFGNTLLYSSVMICIETIVDRIPFSSMYRPGHNISSPM